MSNMLRTMGAWAFAALAVQTAMGQTNRTYTNPILDTVGADPFVIQHDGYYYMTYTTATNITILRSKSLVNWNNADKKLAFDPPMGMNYSTDLWAPELHLFNQKWYVIFTADPANDTPSPAVDMYCPFNCPAINHRMYVLESSDADPWTSKYALKAQLDTYDQFAIDGTYFQHTSGLYHIYSCWETAYSSWPANLCITKMSDPWTVSSSFSERVILSTPSEPWEKTPYGRTVNDRLSSNEGPQQLTNPATGQNFVIYSAGRSDNRNYCLGLLELVGDDPMSPGDWKKEKQGCVFSASTKNGVFGVGHASFVRELGNTTKQDWVVYHGMKDPERGWGDRTVRTQRFAWDGVSGRPVFPRPGIGPYEVPSAE